MEFRAADSLIKLNIIDKHLPQLIKRKKERSQISKNQE